MTGGDKILSRIKSDCGKKIFAIEAESDKVCADIIAKGKAEAEKAAAEINRRAQIKANQIKEASKSRSELEIRNALLKNRRKEIDDTIDLILEYMTQLDD
ncbi:MAG: hypothetical protein LUF33_08115, partial [Clostridiales bacterium]|nr:hypothetical protein [Clostridiales bacterium]